MTKEIREQLLSMSEKDYMEFSSALIPGVNDMLGIRLPKLRTLAKQIAKKDWEEAMEEQDIYFEEKMLRGMVISYAIKNLQQAVPYIEAFIPLVDNWSICDSVFSGMNVFQKDREFTWEWIQKYLDSGKEFEVRVALIIMMQHLLKTDESGRKMQRLGCGDKGDAVSG
ncbi:MAG: DNA alkylation repair protein [Lachnospiraceae bacterium]|nr:DNA alkylation repair protein [Lachnospiraceae bacterium]